MFVNPVSFRSINLDSVIRPILRDSTSLKTICYRLQIIESVSYTHLDVYKRQVLENADRRSSGFYSHIHLHDGYTPVSYTHLDVYKRQGNHWLKTFLGQYP